jgi:hypothetical protein
MGGSRRLTDLRLIHGLSSFYSVTLRSNTRGAGWEGRAPVKASQRPFGRVASQCLLLQGLLMLRGGLQCLLGESGRQRLRGRAVLGQCRGCRVPLVTPLWWRCDGIGGRTRRARRGVGRRPRCGADPGMPARAPACPGRRRRPGLRRRRGGTRCGGCCRRAGLRGPRGRGGQRRRWGRHAG